MSLNESSFIEKIREIRTLKNPVLKPSSYNATHYLDEYEEKKEVVLRDYQKVGVINLLMVPNMILADDTGLGKTIIILNSLGYIFLKEPEYIPIVITTKSALFQWKNETDKFMENMEPVVVHGSPLERENIYINFFENYDETKKRILLLTYDNIMYDLEPSIVRDQKTKIRPTYKKELTNARKSFKDSKERNEILKQALDDLVGQDLAFQMFAVDIAKAIKSKNKNGVDNLLQNEKPVGWTDLHTDAVKNKVESSENLAKMKEILDNLVSESSKMANGISHYIASLKLKNPKTKFMLVMDEAHKLKNHKSQFHQKVEVIAKLSDRKIAVTATPVKNRLMEFFSIFKIIQPSLFPKISYFQNDFCVTKLQRISGGRMVPIIVGYKNLDKFNGMAEPYFLSRKKYEVAKDLPTLISREIECELLDEQEELYDLAELGALTTASDDEAAEVLKSLTFCQQAANSPRLILNDEGEPFEGESSKINCLIELLQDEASEKKVIVYSRFEKMISETGRILEEKKIKYVRITGKENKSKDREDAKNKFQDVNSGINVILITNAGSESINLQAAEHFVFLDFPWSMGDYIQLTGRMIRIGSSHNTVVAHHMLAIRQNGEKTIDHHVLKALRLKKKLMDKVAGDNLVGGLQFVSEDIVGDVLKMMRGLKAGDPGSLLQQYNEKLEKAKLSKIKTTKKIKNMDDFNVSSNLVFDFND